MKKIARFASIVLVAPVLAGCITSYQYHARGDIETTDGGERAAVFYWHKDEGRLWYGKRYEQWDTTATLRRCGATPLIFPLDEDDQVSLQSKSGDLRVARLDSAGRLVMIGEPQRLPDGENCGVILLKGKPANTMHLDEGTSPAASIFCQNDLRPDRYPATGQYALGPVVRKVADKERTAPDPCIEG